MRRIYYRLKDFLTRCLIHVASHISRWMSKVHVPWSHKKLSGEDYFKISEILRPGDQLVTATFGELSTLFVPGDWKHIATAIDQDYVVEATTKGVIKTNLVDFVMKKDAIMVLRPRFMTKEECLKAVEIGQSFVGKAAYDFSFATGDVKEFYCSEHSMYSISKAIEPRPFPLPAQTILGRRVYSPSSFVDDRWFEVVYVKRK